MTPSADRTASTTANEATFILTNVVPQAPENNQGLWADLEAHACDLVAQGNELYIVFGGAGSLGTLAEGKLTIPTSIWKAIVVLPAGAGDDAARVRAQTQMIAVWTPNDASVAGKGWEAYTTSVRCIEQRTGLDLFAAVADEVEAAIEDTDCQEGVSERVSLPMLFEEVGSTPVTPTPITPTPVTPTPVTPTPSSVTISAVEYDPPGDDVQGEYVVIRNGGGSAADLTGWTLRDLANNAYTFPSFSLAAGVERGRFAYP